MKHLLDSSDFEKFLHKYGNLSFSSEKEDFINSKAKSSLFTSQQVKTFLKTFSFDSDKLKAIYKLYNSLIDPENNEDFIECLSFDSSKKDARNFIEDSPVPNNQCNMDNSDSDSSLSNHKVLDDDTFKDYFSKFNNASFSDEKKKVLKKIVKFYFLNSQQILRIIKEISFGSDKLKAAKILYPYITDPQNSTDILEAFSFSSEKEKFNEMIDTLPLHYNN